MDHTITLGSYILHWIFQTSHRGSVGQTITINPCVSLTIADCGIGYLIQGLWQDGQVQDMDQTITLGTCKWYVHGVRLGCTICLTIHIPCVGLTIAASHIGLLILSLWQDGQVEDSHTITTIDIFQGHLIGT